MNVVFSVRIFIASMISISGIVLPRILTYFGLGGLDAMLTPWATFILIMIAGGVLLWPWFRNVKLFLPLIILLLVVAMALTFYFCEMALPF